MDLYTDGGEFILTNQTAVIVAQRHTHEYLVPGNSSLLVVDVANGTWPDLDGAIAQSVGVRVLGVSRRLAELIGEAKRESIQLDSVWKPSERYLDAFISAVAATLRPSEDDRVTVTVNRLEGSHKAIPGIGELAARVGLSAPHLSRLFQNHLGMPPARLARLRRLERAAQLLTSTDCPVADIAAVCGYSDQATFTRAFSRKFSVSPGRLRNDRRSRAVQESAKTG